MPLALFNVTRFMEKKCLIMPDFYLLITAWTLTRFRLLNYIVGSYVIDPHMFDSVYLETVQAPPVTEALQFTHDLYFCQA